MKNDNHTPGEWYLDYCEYEVAGFIYIMREGKVLAETMSQEVADKIVAIPDLLSALEAVEWNEERSATGTFEMFCPCCGWKKEEGHDPHCQLNQALKKARGGE